MELEKKEENTVIISSPSSSPCHEFSFTSSLDSSSSSSQMIKQREISASSAIDLTPADDIFFHGHLLPLHFLSHLHASGSVSSPPRHSMDNFTLPIPQQEHIKPTQCVDDHHHSKTESKGRSLRQFSLFKWRKGAAEQVDQKKKVNKFDVTQFVKRYIKLVKPEMRKGEGIRRQTYSFSGAVSTTRDIRGRRAEFSAPASMRTSPTNSGRLLPSSGVPSSASSNSTMEELQAAIQAAIAHCKNSTQVHVT